MCIFKLPSKENISIGNFNLSGNVLGAIWMLFAALFFTGVNVFVKQVGRDLHFFQLVFFRCLLQFIILSPFLFRHGIKLMATDKIRLYFIRLSFGIGSMMMLFYAITNIPLGMAVSITFSRSLFMILFAIPFLGETVNWHKGLATLAGFIGVVIVMRPDTTGLSLPVIAALATAVSIALTYIFIKKLAATENPIAMMLWFSMSGALVAFTPSVINWQPVSIDDVLFMALAALFGCIAQFCTIRAYYHGEATVVGPFDYFQILFAGIAGFFFFTETPDIWTVVGSVIIVVSTIYILRKK